KCLALLFIMICYVSLSHAQEQAQTENMSVMLREDYGALFARTEKPPQFPAKNIQLGKKLFFDKKLSDTGTISCASCHHPDKAFTDGLPTSRGKNGKILKRKTMSLYNVADDPFFLWDGRAKTLEEQFFLTLQHPDEMNMTSERLEKTMTSDPDYVKAFRVLKIKISAENIAGLVATYVRSLSAPQTRFDDWLEGDDFALTPSELRGFHLFNNKANCTACHIGPDFTDDMRNDIGLNDSDLGLGAITGQTDDHHFFKTPGLRAIKHRAPYMHHGAFATLEEVIDHYNDGGFKRGETDIPPEEDQTGEIAFHNFTQPLNLTEDEKKDLIAFLKSL
ncbi:MAG: cytochrome c peroxidase, partial [Pseudomonadota bacterium]